MLILWLQRHPRLIDWALLLAALATAVGAAAHHSDRAIGITLTQELLFRADKVIE